jgi:hypothetical protein
MRASKLGGRAAKLGSVAAVAVGLLLGSSGTAAASTDANYVFASTHRGVALTWGFPGGPFQISFRSRTAVNVSFRVNGQAYGQGGFDVPAEQGPTVADPSAAYASSSDCEGCLTNAIAITVDVLSGPVNSVYAPTNAVARDNFCDECNTLAADYTFVVAPGAVASLTPAGLSDLSSIASQVTAAADTEEPSQALAAQVTTALGSIAAVLGSQTDVDPVAAPESAAVPAPQTQAGVQDVQPQTGVQAVQPQTGVQAVQPQTEVQEFGETQYSTAEDG